MEQTLAASRELVWIVHGRQEIKKVIGRCVKCKVWTARPCHQKMGELPEFRITSSHPFEHVGTDFTGALLTKDAGKVYVVVFSCAVTRAVHLEIVDNMSTDEFLSAFEAFCNRRGNPTAVYSDNATTY